MAAYFFDSSAVVKRYSSETGSKWIFGVLRPSAGNTVYVARITAAETIAALAGKRKGNQLKATEAAKAIARFKNHFDRRYQKIAISSDVIASAMIYAEKYALRGYDAIQLAAAIEIDSEYQQIGLPRLIFVSADNELNDAAQAEGLRIENPNNYP